MKKQMTNRTMELVSLVIANRADEAIIILDGDDYDKDILNDLFAYSEISGEYAETFPLPLYLLTKANEIYFRHDDFRDTVMPIVHRNREGIKKLLNYWESKGYPIDVPIDFEKYRELCAHFYFQDDDDWDYLLDGTLSQLIEKGYDENEAKMCMALLTYDKPEIDHQITLGTNPDVWISGDVSPEFCDWKTGMNGLTSAYDSVSDAQICYCNWAYWESKSEEKLQPVGYDQIRGLFGASAYEELIPTLERLAGKSRK